MDTTFSIFSIFGISLVILTIFIVFSNDENSELFQISMAEAELENCKKLNSNNSLSLQSEKNLSGCDLSGLNLRNADLREVNLSGANLSGADLTGADLREADLQNTILYGADLREADLFEADLGGANLSGANLRDTVLESANLDNMYQSLEGFVEYVKSSYPKIQLEAAIMDFNHTKSFFQNSNGVDFKVREGMYGFSPMFLSKDGKDTSSFNGTGFSALNVEKPLHKYGSIDALLKESSEQLHTKHIPNKFVGQLMVTPDCICDFLGFIISDISDGKMISGNSLYKEKLNEQITHPKLSFHSHPVSEEIDDGYFVTSDGYVAKNSTIIDKGILKTHLLGIYGSNKLGKNRAVNDGGAYIVDAREKSQEKIIKGIKQGVLLSRFSGGYPASNGDCSGVAKNSYYIENGEIKYPITETMVSGNAKEMFENLDEISKDRIDFGVGILPWISFNDITVS